MKIKKEYLNCDFSESKFYFYAKQRSTIYESEPFNIPLVKDPDSQNFLD